MALLAAVDFGQGVTDAAGNVVNFALRAVVLLAVVVIGYFVAKALAKACDKVLERVGFDKAVERGGVRKALANSQYDASDVLSKIVFYGIMLLVLQLGFSVMGPNAVSDMLSSVISYLPNIFAALVIVVVMSAIAAGAREILDASIGEAAFGKVIANAAGTAIVVVGIFAALNQLAIAPEIVNGLFYAALATFVGIAVVAIGGSGIRPLQAYWESTLKKAEQATSQIAASADGASDRIKQRAEDRVTQAQQAVDVRETPEEDDGWDALRKTSTGSQSAGFGESGRTPQGF